ncbi:TPA: hypothetical protein ACXL4G_004727 [Klebsiella michiganensis]
MTDITELAQREKFEAWAEERCALPWGYLKNRRTNTGYFSKHDYTSLWTAWKAAGAELVEALEKVQQYAKERDAENQDLMLTVGRLRVEREELESRTVKLPERYAWQLGYIVPDPNGDLLDLDDVIAALAAAGIKVEAE